MVHAPLPWMLGPLIALAACRLVGLEFEAPVGGRQAGQWVIGSALGLYFTPAVGDLVLRLWWLLLAGAFFALRARSIASETRRGVSGVSLKVAPMSRNASAIALAMAAGGAIAPPSPSPFTPYSVVKAGVTR